jgi:hypothetical protein
MYDGVDAVVEVVFTKEEVEELQRDRDTLANGAVPHAARPIIAKLIGAADQVDVEEGKPHVGPPAE